MTESTSPLAVNFHGDASVGRLLAALAPHDDKALVIRYGDRTIRPGYHVTEVKAGSFVTIDCGGNPDTWRETILQVEDLGPDGAQEFMSVGRFRTILDKVAAQIGLDRDARLTLEVGPPETAMQVFDIDSLRIDSDRMHLSLAARPAICKPRHRQSIEAQGAGCCDGAPKRTGCC